METLTILELTVGSEEAGWLGWSVRFRHVRGLFGSYYISDAIKGGRHVE
jgi:hypothetical protein